MAFKNMELRVLKGNIHIKEIAEELGKHHNTIHRWFNKKEMDPVKRKRVELAIESIKRKQGEGKEDGKVQAGSC